MIGDTAHVGGLEKWAVLLIQSLMVSNVVGKDLKVVAYVGKTLGPRHWAHGSAIDSDGNRAFVCENIWDRLKNRVFIVEGNTWRIVSKCTENIRLGGKY